MSIRSPGAGTSPVRFLLVIGLVLPAAAPAQTGCAFAWDGAFGNPGATGISGYPATLVNDLLSSNDGTSPVLYATGSFSAMGGVPANGIARWNGVAWSALGSGLNGPGRALAVFDEGSGPALFVGGSFSAAGGVTVNGIARWDGTAWSSVGGGMNGVVEDLIVFDAGNGAALFACGWFTQAGSVAAALVARWSGTAWTPVGGGLGAVSIQGQYARCFAVHDAGPGPMLHVGGFFFLPSPYVCRLQGGAWVGLAGAPPATIGTLLSHDDGTGPALYAGSLLFTGIQRWNGTAWSVAGAFLAQATELILADTGNGTRLHVSGSNLIRSWDGAAWVAPAGMSDASGPVYGIATHDDGTGTALYAGGSFSAFGTVPQDRIARWRQPIPVPLCFQPGGPGAAVYLANYGLVTGNAYQNVVSDVLCPGGPNTGPWLGLCAGDPAFLLGQIALPPGVAPFHYQATALTSVFGPFALPPALTFELVSFDRTGNVLGCSGPAIRYTVQ